MISYDNRKFRLLDAESEGDVDSSTIFHYSEAEYGVTGTYSGGIIAHGSLVARKLEDGSLQMRYHHLTTSGELKSGRCTTRPEVRSDGGLLLHESWQWTDGDEGSGTSILMEIK